MAAGKIEKLVGSIIVGLTAAVLYLIARRSLGVPGSLLIVFIFAFCTAAWSTASRALWQHGPSMLMLTLALWLFVLARERPRAVSLAGLPLAFAYVVRPTNAVAIAVLSALVLIRHRRYFLPYLLWMLPVAVAFLLFTLSVYHALLPPYYAAGKVGHAGGFALALAGSLVSPARGLLVFSPIFLFSVYGILLSLGCARDRLDDALAAVIALHWAMLASFPIWWGGHSFGYRLFADMVPYLTYFLIPVVARIPALSGSRRVAVAAAFAALVAISFAINYRGANARAVYAWNSDPVDVDVAPSRLWDWRDLQFARGLWPPPAGPSGTERH